MSANTEADIATAGALKLLLYNQHTTCAEFEELSKWLADNGVGSSAEMLQQY